jgi:anti-anti-sigma factor
MLTEARAKSEIVSMDLHELTFIDGGGLGAIVESAPGAAGSNTRLVAVGATGQVKRLLELTGVLASIESVDFDPSEPPLPSREPLHASSNGATPQHSR